MSLSGKPVEQITESDLDELITNQVREGKVIDYKEALPGNSPSDRKEFLADVSSFANASGGHLIYGMKESAGMPTEVCGLDLADVDATIARLDNLIRNGLDPRAYVSVFPITVKTSKTAIIIRVPRSWSLPHMVTLEGHDKFYSRDSNGKHRLDVGELRALFALSETTGQHLRRFRAERLSNIVAGETPVLLQEGSKSVLHIVPLSAFAPGAPPTASLPVVDILKIPPIRPGGGWSFRINFDGMVTFAHDEGTAFTYVQLFRNGAIEAVDTRAVNEHEGTRIIPGNAYEAGLIGAVSRFLSVQREIGTEPPLLIMLSLLGVRGCTMFVGYLGHERDTVDRDDLLIPEVLVDSFESDIGTVMRPVFDALWNATGHPGSPSYDDAGKWREAKG